MEPRKDITDRTFAFAVSVIRLCCRLGRMPGAPRTISNQLLRSGTSIGANVEEAQAAQSRKDFICKNSVALKEARETRYWLRALIASEVMAEEPVPKLLQESDELCRILGAIIVRTKANTEAS